MFPRIPRHGVTPFVLGGGPDLDSDILWFLQRYPLTISPEDQERLEARKVLFEARRREIGAILSPDWKPTKFAGFRDGEGPWPYQAQAAEIARRLGRLLVGDEVGLGKTVTAIATFSDPEYLPAAVIVQPHLAIQWSEKIGEFTHLRTHIVEGRKPYELPEADVYIFAYTNVAGWVDYVHATPFRTVVADEIQELRHGQKTKKGGASDVFFRQAHVRLGLTATPIYNYGDEMWNVVEYISPGDLGTWDDFRIEWCIPHGGHLKVEDPKALGTFLREKNIFLRRVENDVSKQMPPVNTIIHTVDLDQEVLDAADNLARSLAITVVSGTFEESGMAAREFNNMMRHNTGVAKARHVAGFVKILLDNKVPVLLGGWHRDVYDIWLSELAAYKPVLYTGTETPKAKDAAKRAFVDGETDLLVISLRSGSGLDGLQYRTHTCVIGELDWSPQVHHQLIGRARRPGQQHQVDAIYLVANGGADPYMLGTLGIKSSQSHGILDPLAGATTQHSDASRIRQLAEQYLRSKEHLMPAGVAPRDNLQGQLFGGGQ